MGVHYLISGLLLIAALLILLRPQRVSTLRHYSKEQLAEVDLRRVRRTGSLGTAALALLIGPGSWLLHRAGVDEATLTALGIVVLAVGLIAIAARIETYNKNRQEGGK